MNLYNNKRQPGSSQILRIFKRIETGDIMYLLVWQLWNIIPSKTSVFTIAADQSNLLKSHPTTNAFFKIFNNFQNSCSTKQLRTAASNFSQKSWKYVMKRILVGQNMREPIHYSLFLSDESAINFLLWKSAHVFL